MDTLFAAPYSLKEEAIAQLSCTHTYKQRLEYVSPLVSPSIRCNYEKVTTTSSSQKQTFKKDSSAAGLRKEGNNFLARQEFAEAVTLFTMSAAAAPCSDSNSLALALAQRSTALMSLGLLEESLADAQRALDRGYPALLSFKLLLQQARCLEGLGRVEEADLKRQEARDRVRESALPEPRRQQLLRDMDQQPPSVILENSKRSAGDVPQPSNGTNEDFSTASRAIELRSNEQYGRHFVATRDINPGDVLIVEEPLAAVLEPEYRWTHCSHCMRRCSALLPCPDCDWALFCSESCQNAASQQYHRVECPVVARYSLVRPHDSPHELQLYVPLLMRLMSSLGASTLEQLCEEDTQHQGIASLMSHFEHRDLTGSVLDCIHVLSVVQCFEFPRHHDQAKLSEASLKLLNTLYVNAQSVVEQHIRRPCIYEEDSVALHQVGVGLFATSSLMNHSCAPNTVVTFHERARVVRAARFIPQGEQITDSYGVTFTICPKPERQSLLEKKYYFSCKCEACENDWPEIESLPRDPEFAESEKKLATKFKKSETLLNRVDNGMVIKEKDLKIFEDHMILMCKHGKRRNQNFCLLQHSMETYYRSLGNCIFNY